LVADTHLVAQRPLPPALLEGLSSCDVIFHAGDILRPWVLERLESIAPAFAVYGNGDEANPDMMRMLTFERYFRCGEHRIGLLHGHHHAGKSRVTAREYAFDRMRGLVDWVVYGHSHQPKIEERDGLWMINPGSPTQPRWAPRPTWGTLDVGEQVRAQLIDL
ncbi:MAG: metallophosphatase family protein, partial [Thermomicrobiales bacterium]|nr:metallophosphatase family protein [Thermomicrobiales bacterium]